MKSTNNFRLITRTAFIGISFFALALPSCKEKEEIPRQINHAPYPGAVRSCLFENGSWWAFEDSVTAKKDTLILSSVHAGYRDFFTGDNVQNTCYEYEGSLYQTSTKRKYSIMYSSVLNGNRKDYPPVVTLRAYNNDFGEGYEHILFNTNIGDTLLGGFAFPDTLYYFSRFILQEKGTGITLPGKTYNEAYYKMKIFNSVAYDRKDMELWLIENVGFAHHTMGGNFYLVDHSAVNIVP